MGTNFYWKLKSEPVYELAIGERHELPIDSMDPAIHIGKRSAAGFYCWPCGVTLCQGGEAAVHSGTHAWYPACPKCGAKPEHVEGDKGVIPLATAVELGFAKPRTSRPPGVRSCSSFLWAQDPARVRQLCEAHLGEVVIVDEYDRELTGGQFLAMLRNNCPIEFTNSIGNWFC